MQTYFRRLSEYLYASDSIVRRGRTRRMQRMIELLNVPENARVIDLGGTVYNWQLVDHSYHVTMVNLPGANTQTTIDDPRYRFVHADACDLRDEFEDRSFDLVFSNSTIEHVGDFKRQKDFAREVLRLASGYWVQTPSSRCVLEVHTGIPLYWQLPNPIKARLHKSWKSNLPDWFNMISETRVLDRQRMRELFPNANLYVERVFAFEKSYAAYSPCDSVCAEVAKK